MNFQLSRPPVIQDRLYDRIAVTLYFAPKDIDEAREVASIQEGKTYRLEELGEKKTLSQIGTAWMLMRKLADHRNDGMTDDDIYREYVRRFGKYEVKAYPDEVAQDYMNIWVQLGTSKKSGWQVEVVNQYDGMTEFICYKGMSAWNRKELSSFISQLLDDCRELKIPIRYL